MRGLLGLMRLGDVCDIASGDCAIAELLAPRARHITCLDLSRRVLGAGKRRMKHLGHVAFRRGDMHALPFADESFDQVLLLACLNYARDPERAVAEASRVLRPGGSIVAVTLKRHGHQEHAARYDHLQPGFSPRRLKAMFLDAGLGLGFLQATSRERRAPHFEVITVHAGK